MADYAIVHHPENFLTETSTVLRTVSWHLLVCGLFEPFQCRRYLALTEPTLRVPLDDETALSTGARNAIGRKLIDLWRKSATTCIAMSCGQDVNNNLLRGMDASECLCFEAPTRESDPSDL
jgi:hypothetical protein